MKVQEDAPMGSGEWGGRPSRILSWSPLYHLSVEADTNIYFVLDNYLVLQNKHDRNIRQLKQYSSSLAKESLCQTREAEHKCSTPSTLKDGDIGKLVYYQLDIGLDNLPIVRIYHSVCRRSGK